MTIIECPLRITENGFTSNRPPTAWRKLHSYPAIYGLADPASGTLVLLEFDPFNLDEAEARWLADVRRQGGGDLNVADVRIAGEPR